MRRIIYVFLTLASTALALFLLSCGSGTTSTTMSAGTVNVSISDPATCSAPSGQFSHIFVTIADVMIHQSATAAPADAGWVDLTPTLKNAPVQTDLLGLATNQCFLAMLGSTGIQPGTFQQIRIILADNSATLEGNKCGSTTNCVMLTSDPSNTPHALLLSSEAQTGIKVPSGQIAGGQFTVAAGQNKDLNIDFNACASIVSQGNGQFRLKPVLHAGEVSTTSSSISGTVLDGATRQPIVGITVVALEQKDANGVDRVIMETLAGANGAFVLCPVPAGTYDVVVTAINGTGTTDYAATVITGVQPGNALGNVPLTAAAAPAIIAGQITSSTGSVATVADLSISALQPIVVNGANLLITTPLPGIPAATDTLSTAPGASCPANTDCASYLLAVPAANPSVGAFVTTGNQTPAPPAAGVVNYTVDTDAFSGGVADCTPSNLQTNQTTANVSLAVTAAGSQTAKTLAFTACK